MEIRLSHVLIALGALVAMALFALLGSTVITSAQPPEPTATVTLPAPTPSPTWMPRPTAMPSPTPTPLVHPPVQHGPAATISAVRTRGRDR